MSLVVLADMLGKSKRPAHISIDEFQLISNCKRTVIDTSISGFFHKMKTFTFYLVGVRDHCSWPYAQIVKTTYVCLSPMSHHNLY